MAAKRPHSLSPRASESNKRVELANGTAGSPSARHDDLHSAAPTSISSVVDISRDPRRKQCDSAATEESTLHAHGSTRSSKEHMLVCDGKKVRQDTASSETTPQVSFATSLAKLCNNISERAALKISKDEAQSRWETAESDYQRYRDRYSDDATKMEKFKNMRDSAHKVLKEKAAAIEESDALQVQLILHLLKCFEETKTGLEADLENKVTRTELEALVKQNHKLEQDIKSLRVHTTTLSGEVQKQLKTTTTTTKSLTGKIEDLQQIADRAVTKADMFNSKAKLSTVESRLGVIEQKLNGLSGDTINKLLENSQAVTETSSELVKNTKQRISEAVTEATTVLVKKTESRFEEISAQLGKITIARDDSASAPLLLRINDIEEELRLAKETIAVDHESSELGKDLDEVRVRYQELEKRIEEVAKDHEEDQDDKDAIVVNRVQSELTQMKTSIQKDTKEAQNKFREELLRILASNSMSTRSRIDKIDQSLENDRKVLAFTHEFINRLPPDVKQYVYNARKATAGQQAFATIAPGAARPSVVQGQLPGVLGSSSTQGVVPINNLQATSTPTRSVGPSSIPQQLPQALNADSTLSPNVIAVFMKQYPGVLQSFDKKNAELTRHINAAICANQALKERMDNLTTETLAQQIWDQLGTVYPGLKEKNSAIERFEHGLRSYVQERYNSLELRLAQLEESSKRKSPKDSQFQSLGGSTNNAPEDSLSAITKFTKDVGTELKDLQIKFEQHLTECDSLTEIKTRLSTLEEKCKMGEQLLSTMGLSIQKHERDIIVEGESIGKLQARVDHLERENADGSPSE